MHLELLSRAGILPIRVVGAPGAQGAAITGMQGIGVRTPRAAVVAVATVGLASDIHIPKVGMLAIGLLSIILAAGMFPTRVLLVGATINEAGATPKEHIINAPITT
jgi:hypothetical protein